ncbi:hypothetical protein C8J36_103559 [Rhizobium sp. PP-F2F-G48]|uniref:hypothetical protein n=1 Tax=Rhizobium sp. PP-F2F-G48 TaxID=2135651 RepID=UPI0010456CC5|nr:hypothetical protein [Rhizobium sp. PP-F2F-G48]TCM56189.1 hypothetical protein C8J36_103559 [Rhizobium sp. PP-F2F-G48]
MTLEEAANAVRLYVEAKPYDDGRMNKASWLERLDDCLTDIRLELAEAAQDDGLWSKYLDMATPSPQTNVLTQPQLPESGESVEGGELPRQFLPTEDGEFNGNELPELDGINVDNIAKAIVLAACELDDTPDPDDDDTLLITVQDLEAVAHRHITVALERAALAAPTKERP